MAAMASFEVVLCREGSDPIGIHAAFNATSNGHLPPKRSNALAVFWSSLVHFLEDFASKKDKKRPLWPRGLVIFHIEPHSAVVARWNAGHSDRCLASRQVIVSINGIEAMEDMVGH